MVKNSIYTNQCELLFVVFGVTVGPFLSWIACFSKVVVGHTCLDVREPIRLMPHDIMILLACARVLAWWEIVCHWTEQTSSQCPFWASLPSMAH